MSCGTPVPAAIRNDARGPVATAYERVTFDLDRVIVDGARAELLAPGHPLHDAVTEATIARHRDALDRGTILISPAVTEPRLLVGLVTEVVDATDASVARRFTYAYIDAEGNVEEAGPAPYLDCVAPPATGAVEAAHRPPWLSGAEAKATSWVIANQLADYLEEVRLRRGSELEKVREQVDERLREEYERLMLEAMVAREKEGEGKKPKESHASLTQKAADLASRRDKRLRDLARQLEMQAKPPRVVTAALVLPLAAVEDEVPAQAPIHAIETEEVERRGVDLVLATEVELDRHPVEQAHNNPGFDVLSQRQGEDPVRIEVKARIAGAEDFFVTHNEVLTALNSAPRYRLALVRVDPRGPEHDDVRYLENPFSGFDAGDFAATGHRGKWKATWAKGREPF